MMNRKEAKESAARLLALRSKSILAMMKDGVIKIGPIFPEKNMTETDTSDRPRVAIYRRRRQKKNRASSYSRAYNLSH